MASLLNDVLLVNRNDLKKGHETVNTEDITVYHFNGHAIKQLYRANFCIFVDDNNQYKIIKSRWADPDSNDSMSKFWNTFDRQYAELGYYEKN